MDIHPLTLEDLPAWSKLLAVSFERQPAQMAKLLAHFYGERQLIAWGAWDGTRLAAQYSCLLTELWLPSLPTPQTVGMSINMAVHPDYRGQGLVKHVSQPVYAEVAKRGGIAGVGFSNAAGVKVDKRSSGYGYRVIGKMVSLLAVIAKRPSFPLLTLTSSWPTNLLEAPQPTTAICFAPTPQSLEHRFAHHPFRRYQFGILPNGAGVVVYRPFRQRGIAGVSLLAAYGADQTTLLGGWLHALTNQGIRVVHVVVSPNSQLRRVLQRQSWCFPLPIHQTPYFLTAKPLQTTTPAALFDFVNWDCTGGDIL